MSDPPGPRPGADGASPTIRDVARAAQTSKSTVSNVISGRGRMAPETRMRVLAAMDALGYRANAAARSLAARRSAVLGVVVGDLTDSFNAEIAARLEHHAAAAGYAVLLVNSDVERESELLQVETLIEHRVAAIVFVAFSGTPTVVEAIPRSVAVVFATVHASAGTSVTVDEQRALDLVVDHLADLGHRRIAYASTAYERAIDDVLFDSFANAMARRRLPVRERAVLRWGLDGVHDEGEAKLQALDALLAGARRPTAVFASSDRTALQVLDAAARAELDVPADLSVVGWGNTEMARAEVVGLTTIAQPVDELARRAIEIATAAPAPRRRRGRTVTLDPRLVVRRTTAAPCPR